MTDLPSKPATLNLPQIEPVEYERNFIKNAVCELRFPALLEYETKSPIQLQKEVRKEFPNYERRQSVSLGAGDPVKEIKHLFKSKKGDWVIAFKSSSILIETTRYTGFDEFQGRVKYLMDVSSALLDTDFFTRVGLRYINEIPLSDGKLTGVVRDELIIPILQGVYGDCTHFFQDVRGFVQTGGYTFKHGLSDAENDKPRSYIIDFDLYEENVQRESTLELVDGFNKESFRFFSWAIGPKTRESLGKTVKKAR